MILKMSEERIEEMIEYDAMLINNMERHTGYTTDIEEARALLGIDGYARELVE